MEKAVRMIAPRAMNLPVSMGPGAKSGPHCNEHRSDNENRAFQHVRCGCVLDEPPYDIFAVDQIRDKSGPDDKLMDQCLVTILEISSFQYR
jgi:hypothetical protein